MKLRMRCEYCDNKYWWFRIEDHLENCGCKKVIDEARLEEALDREKILKTLKGPSVDSLYSVGEKKEEKVKKEEKLDRCPWCLMMVPMLMSHKLACPDRPTETVYTHHEESHHHHHDEGSHSSVGGSDSGGSFGGGDFGGGGASGDF